MGTEAVNDAVAARMAAAGIAVVEMTRDGRFDAVEALFAPGLRAAASAGTLEVAWTAERAKLGPVREIGTPVTKPGAAQAR